MQRRDTAERGSAQRWGLALCALLLVCAPRPAQSEPATPAAEAGQPSGRRARVEQCIACHPKVGSSWREGPHSHGFESLVEHQKKIRHAPEYFAEPLRNAFRDEIPGFCSRCHAAGNVFEMIHGDPWKGKPLAGDTSSLQSTRPQQTQETGVDCLTCHWNGDHVIAAADYRRSTDLTPPPGFCAPRPSPILTSNGFCSVCHPDAMASLSAYPHQAAHRGAELGETCIGCHQATTASGEGTHFFPWRWQPEHRGGKLKFHPVVKGLEVSVEQRGKGRVLVVSLKNDFTRHNYPAQSLHEVGIEVSILGPGAEPLLRKMHRVSQEAYLYSKRDPNAEPSPPAPGPETLTLMPGRVRLEREYPLDASVPAHGTIEVVFRYKSQYFLPDTYFVEIGKRQIRY